MPLSKFAKTIAVTLFAALFCTFIIQITARFGFNKPLAWSDELAVVLYIWTVLWCAAFVVPEREHVRFDLLHDRASPAVRRVMRFVGCLALAGLALCALRGNWDYIQFMGREKTPVLSISFFWVFLPFAFLLASLVVRFGWGAYKALREPA